MMNTATIHTNLQMLTNNNRLYLILSLWCCACLGACANPEGSGTEVLEPEGNANKHLVELSAPKDGFSVNLDAIDNLTFWWNTKNDKADSYELVFSADVEDFSSPLASYDAGQNTEFTVPFDELKKIYDATRKDGVATIAWSVNSIYGKKQTIAPCRMLKMTYSPEPYEVKALFLPEDGARADLVILDADVEFKWSAAESKGNKEPEYTLLFDIHDGDFSAPVAALGAGKETALTVSKDYLQKLFDENAEQGNMELSLQWAVKASVGENSWISTVSNDLLVTTLPVAYRNPVFTDFSLPDPDVIRGDDGYFYLYATEHNRKDPDMKNSPVMRSSDLVNWTRVGALFTDQTHPQITDQNPAGIWAPSINKIGDKYVVYYSQPGKNYKHAIGVAVSSVPQGPFKDLGKLIDSNEQGVDISIDAYLYQEDGRNYLFWGSFRSISVLELTEDGTAIKNKDTQKRIEVAGGQYEATVLHKRDGWYYLILSTGDYSKGGTYRLVAGRSKSIFGPYVDRNGNDMMSVHHELILKGDGNFSSPGHCSRIITDDAGQDWILYHAYRNDMDYRCLMLDKVEWIDGWPVVAGMKPTTSSVIKPVFNK